MAYIGGRGTTSKSIESGIGLMTVLSTQSHAVNVTSLGFVNVNADTTTTLVATNNYYVRGQVNIADTKTWTIAGNGELTII
jgi:maltoporin